jgi:hypothetical protein
VPLDVGTKGTDRAKKSVFVAPGNHDGMVARGNLDIANRPVVHNGDGSISTVRSITVTQDGEAYLIPTVVGGKVVSNKQAISHWQQTGEHLGVFKSEDQANAYGQRLHSQQAQAYLEPPQPALQAAGVNFGIKQFNDRVQAVTDAYQTGVRHEAARPALRSTLSGRRSHPTSSRRCSRSRRPRMQMRSPSRRSSRSRSPTRRTSGRTTDCLIAGPGRAATRNSSQTSSPRPRPTHRRRSQPVAAGHLRGNTRRSRSGCFRSPAPYAVIQGTHQHQGHRTRSPTQGMTLAEAQQVAAKRAASIARAST